MSTQDDFIAFFSDLLIGSRENRSAEAEAAQKQMRKMFICCVVHKVHNG
jgi:hypothetical protein